MINFIKQAVESVEGIKSFLFNTDYRNNFDLQDVEFPCCVLTPIMRTNYDLNNIIRESAELQLSVVDSAPYEYTGDDLYDINKRCSDLALQVIANLQVKSKLDKELTFEFILPSGDELISGVMCNLTATMKQGSCIGTPSYIEVIVQPIKRESITSNGIYHITPSSGFNAMREVEVDVQVYKPNLQGKSITIAENGTQTITADSEFDGLNSVEVTTDVNTLQGLDFSEIYDQEQANDLNQYYKEAIEETKRILAHWNYSSTDINSKFAKKEEPFYFPNVDLYNITSLAHICQYTNNLLSIPKKLNLPNCKTLRFAFSGIGTFIDTNIFLNNDIDVDLYGVFNVSIYTHSVKIYGTKSVTNMGYLFNGAYFTKEIFIESVESCTNFTETFRQNGYYASPKEICIKFGRWKQTDISLKVSTLTPESIHYIIQNAMNVADGAEKRTLTLDATAKANWQNSEYYEQDLAVLEQKGITIA